MSYELKDRQLDAGKTLFKDPTLPEEVENFRQPVDYEDLIGDMTLNKLHEIFKSIVKKQEDRVDPIRSQYGKIEKDEINLDAKQNYIVEYVRKNKKFSFRSLLEKQGSKMETIVTFLVILELMKIGMINIIQEGIFDDIMIVSNEDENSINLTELKKVVE